MQLDDDAAVVEPLVAGTRRRCRQLDLSVPLRACVFRSWPPYGIQRRTEPTSSDALLPPSTGVTVDEGRERKNACRGSHDDYHRNHRIRFHMAILLLGTALHRHCTRLTPNARDTDRDYLRGIAVWSIRGLRICG